MPQKISSDVSQPISLMFRPSGVYRNSAAVVEYAGRIICRKKAMIFTPGEMVLITLKPEDLRGLSGSELTVRIERS